MKKKTPDKSNAEPKKKKNKSVLANVHKRFIYKNKEYYGKNIKVPEELKDYIISTKKGEIIGNS